MIRLVFALRRKPELSLAEFQDYWRRRHGPLLAGLAEDLNILRYVQTHTIADGTTEGAQRARGNMEPHYDGVEEVWWSSEAGLEAILASDIGRAAGAALLADEAEFIDLPQSPLWFAYEYPQVNPSPENVVAKVKSNVVRVFYPLRPQAVAYRGAGAPLLADPPRPHRAIPCAGGRNAVLPPGASSQLAPGREPARRPGYRRRTLPGPRGGVV